MKFVTEVHVWVFYVVGSINTYSSSIKSINHYKKNKRLHYWKQDISTANHRDTKAKWRFRSPTWTFTGTQANWAMSLFHAASKTNTPENTWHVSTSARQHVSCVLTRLLPPSENILKRQWIAKLFTVGFESKELSVCTFVCVLKCVPTCCCTYVTEGESGRHYHHSALPTIRRHLTVRDNHCRVRKVTTSTVQQQTKGEHDGG